MEGTLLLANTANHRNIAPTYVVTVLVTVCGNQEMVLLALPL